MRQTFPAAYASAASGATRRARASVAMSPTVQSDTGISLCRLGDLDRREDRSISGAAERQRSGAAGSGSEARADARSRRLQRLVRPRICREMQLCTSIAFGYTLCHKLKNGGFNYAGWLSLLPDNLLQAFNDFWGKQALTSFSAHSRRDVLNDEYLPLLLEYVGNFLFLKGFFPHFITHWRFSSP